MSHAIETDTLRRRFGARVAVSELELRVPEGGIYGFLGLNGAGKTTTIRMLLGLIRADDGVVRIFGEPFRREVLARIGAPATCHPHQDEPNPARQPRVRSWRANKSTAQTPSPSSRSTRCRATPAKPTRIASSPRHATSPA